MKRRKTKTAMRGGGSRGGRATLARFPVGMTAAWEKFSVTCPKPILTQLKRQAKAHGVTLSVFVLRDIILPNVYITANPALKKQLAKIAA